MEINAVNNNIVFVNVDTKDKLITPDGTIHLNHPANKQQEETQEE